MYGKANCWFYVDYWFLKTSISYYLALGSTLGLWANIVLAEVCDWFNEEDGEPQLLL